MDFRMNEEQELLLENFREFIARECKEEYFKECDEKHEYPEQVLDALADSGFGLLGIPEEFGGTPVDNLTLMMISEEFARAGGPAYIWPTPFLINDILEFGSEEQKKITMELAKQCRPPFANAISEPQAGSESVAITSSATRKNGKVYINGHKTFITNANYAPYILVLTKDPNAANPNKSISMWWVSADAPGIKVERMNKIGTRMATLYDLYLKDVEVEEKDLVGIEGEGFMQLMKNFEMERLLLAANSLGMAEAAFDDAAKYASQRVQFGQPIGNFQLIQEKLTFMTIKIENMRNMVYKCAWEKDNGISVQLSSALAKIYCGQASFEVIDSALQIFGGIGYTEDIRIPRLWRDARLNRIGGGTDEIMIHIAGRAILKKYK